VRWLRCLGDMTTDHELESIDLVDGEWVDITIEVKATPGKEFLVYMSRGQWECALRMKDRYRLYRVLDVASSTP
jgi:hypothetical protein